MAKKKIAVYLHLVWTTWDCTPWIIPFIENKVYRMITSQMIHLGCSLIAIGGMPDHVHLLIKYPTTVTIAELVKRAKGVSTRMINLDNLVPDHFKWSSDYGVFSVSRWDTDMVKSYITNQKNHHKANNLIDKMEYMLER
jgi:REP element-mobilizing transposase RayT